MKGLVIGKDGLIGGAFQLRAPLGGDLMGTSRKSEVSDRTAIHFDLADRESNYSFLDQKFDYALFTAAVTDINRCEADPKGTALVNVDHTIQMLERLRDHGIFTVFLSTNYVFDGSRPFIAESSPTCPLTEYGRQKALVEAWIQKEFPTAAVVRLSKVLGGSKTIFSGWSRMLKEGMPARAFSDLSIAPVTVDTVCNGLAAILKERAEGFFHISGDDEISYTAACKRLAERLGADGGLVQSVAAREVGYRLPLPKFSSLSVSKLESMMNKKVPSSAAALESFLDELLAG